MVQISTLPHELLGLVAAAADPNDLANLRLTSKDLCAAATRPFGHSRLAHRRFIVSPHSLQGLVELTAHPVLAPCTKTISLGTYRIDDDYEHRLLEFDDTHTNEAAHAAAAIRIQYSFERNGHSLHALRKALFNLKHRNIRVGLSVHDDVVEVYCPQPGDPHPPPVRCIVRGAYGLEQLYGQVDLDRVGRREADRTLSDLYYAIEQSAYNLSALYFDFDKKFYEQNGGAWGTVSDPLVNALVFPNGFTTPVIDFTIKLHTDHDSDISIMRLRSDRSLEIINHAIETAPEETPDLCALPYGMFTVALHQDHFDTIVLETCLVNKALSDVFFRSRSNTLRHLELLSLYDCCHHDHPKVNMQNLWKALERMFNLEVLILEDFEFENNFCYVKIDGRVVLRGAEIRVGLRQLIEKTEEWTHDLAEMRVYFKMVEMVGVGS
jgi:hypothetical protein